MPIFPLCGSAVAEVPAPARATITQARLDNVVKWSISRLQAAAKPLIEVALGAGFSNFAVRDAAEPPHRHMGQEQAEGDAYRRSWAT
jgi:hypothetical protein